MKSVAGGAHAGRLQPRSCSRRLLRRPKLLGVHGYEILVRPKLIPEELLVGLNRGAKFDVRTFDGAPLFSGQVRLGARRPRIRHVYMVRPGSGPAGRR